MDEKQTETNTEAVEQTGQPEEPKKEQAKAPDKPVEQSQFNKYRDAYLREQLSKKGVKDGAEVESAMKFINEKADDTDSNLDDAFRQLQVRMRLDERLAEPKYVDATPMNGSVRGSSVSKHQQLYEIGKHSAQRVLEKKGRIRL